MAWTGFSHRHVVTNRVGFVNHAGVTVFHPEVDRFASCTVVESHERILAIATGIGIARRNADNLAPHWLTISDLNCLLLRGENPID